MVRKEILLLSLLLAGLPSLWGCSGFGNSGDSGAGTQESSLASISISPENAGITKGETLQYTATCTSSDGSSEDCLSLVSWTSLDTTIATISETGLATGTGDGTAEIAATQGSVVQKTRVTVMPAENIYWGDLHVHTGYSRDGDQTTTTDTSCFYGKQNELNFMAVTDHAEFETDNGKMTKAIWDQSVSEIQSGNCTESSTFIPFIGYEWTSWIYGHRSVLFKNLAIPKDAVFSSTTLTTPHSLWRSLDVGGYQDTALTIPHHPAKWNKSVNWNYYNLRYEPVVEVYSEQGNSEYCGTEYDPFSSCEASGSVEYALNTKRYKLGLIAGTDAHDAQAGSVNDPDSIVFDTQPYNGGLIAAYAPALTRDNIWSAIKTRRVYATSGPRIIVRFTINGFPMGSTVQLPAGTKPTLEIHATAATGRIARIDVIKNGKSSAPIHKQWCVLPSVSYSWTDNDYTSGGFYYVRVVQEDLERAWTSPIWVEKQ